MLELVLGGARSGKSAYAQRQASSLHLPVYYLATAQAGDAEMQARITRHRNERPLEWQTVEEPLALAATLQRLNQPGHCILVDCLTLWLTNLLLLEDEVRFQREREELLNVLQSPKAAIILVSNEVGQGIVPVNVLARRFVDEAGWLHQDIAAMADRVTLMAAGLPLTLKGE